MSKAIVSSDGIVLSILTGPEEWLDLVVLEPGQTLVDYDADAPPARSVEEQWRRVRNERNLRLAASDWTQLLDSPLDGRQIAAWAAYRRALRYIVNQRDPGSIVWPSPPDA